MILRFLAFIWAHTTVSNVSLMLIFGVPIIYNLYLYFIHTPLCYIWSWIVWGLGFFRAVGAGVTSFEKRVIQQFGNSTSESTGQKIIERA
jgi:hypothetical protein